MGTVYEKYMALSIDKGLLGLEPGVITTPYFCYPVNAESIGFEGCILYCFYQSMERWYLPVIQKAVQIEMFIRWQQILKILSVWFWLAALPIQWSKLYG